MEKIYNHKDFDSAFEVNNYPWGFRLKTKVRYWIETTNRGDRFVKCTLNPKTNKWCKEKKSTYKAVMVMTKEVKDQKTFISYISISRGWSNAVDVAKFEHQVNKDLLSKEQLKEICACKAINETNSKVKVKFVNSTGWSEEQKAANDKEQAEINTKLAKYTNYVYGQCLVKNNLN